MNAPRITFEMEGAVLPLSAILPIRFLEDPDRLIKRYRAIRSSIKQFGLVEPLMVCRQKDSPQKYSLVDGHLRLHALKELGIDEAECLISTEDEGYTYNARISRLAPIQEHKMIMKAVSEGVKPERIAAALNLSLLAIQKSMKLLDGLHPEAVELLKDKQITPPAVKALKKVTATRQVEMAALMVSSNTFSKSYVDALLMGTPKTQITNPRRAKSAVGMSVDEIAQMEEEMGTLHRDFKSVEASYGENMLNLTFARGYIRKLLENARVTKYLKTRYREIFNELEGLSNVEAV